VIALSTSDWVVGVTAVMSLIVFLWRQVTAGDAAVFNPYPDLAVPGLDVTMILALALLLVPAMIAPDGERA
jgi:hypothetical protein